MLRIKTLEDSNGDDSLPEGWEKSLREADAYAQRLLHCLWNDLEKVFHQRGAGGARRRRRVGAWKENEKFCRWWGSDKVSNEEIKDVRRRVTKLRNLLQKGCHYIVVKEQSGNKSRLCKKGVYAYVVPPLNEGKIRLCPLWFSVKSVSSRASILIHELVHFLGIGTSHQGVETKQDALDLARDRPRRARRSPDNYLHLALEYETCANRLETPPGNRIGVAYQVHVKGSGWLPEVGNGMTAGTTRQRRRIEAFRVKLINAPKGVGVRYRAYVERSGWTNEVGRWQDAGSTGRGRRVEAIQVRLTKAPPGKRVRYRVHAKGRGWMRWVENGATAGTTGQNRRIEAVEIQIVN